MNFLISINHEDPRGGAEALRSEARFTGPEIYIISKVAEYALATLLHYSGGTNPDRRSLLDLAHIPHHKSVADLNPKIHPSHDWTGARLRGFIEFYIAQKSTDLGLLLLTSGNGSLVDPAESQLSEGFLDGLPPEIEDPLFELKYDINCGRELLVAYDTAREIGFEQFARECAQSGLEKVLEELRIPR